MNLLQTFASVFGYFGAILLFFQVVFLGNRNIFSLVTEDTVFINKLHKQIGIYGTVLIFLHPLLEMKNMNMSFLWIFIPDFSLSYTTAVTYGRIAFLLLLVLWVTSALVRGKMKWRPWKYIHLVSYPLVVLVIFHVPSIGAYFEEYVWVRALWYVTTNIFFIATFLRILSWGGVMKRKAKVISKSMQGESILLLTLSLPEGMKIPKIGQHIYMQSRRFGSEHPFTVMDINEEKRELLFGMRTGGLFVEEVKTLSEGSVLYIDGPYGVFTKEAWNDNEKIVIAGGVGVTPFVRLAKEYGKNMTFLYANRSEGDAVRKEEIASEVLTYIDVIENGEAKQNTYVGRITPELLTSVLGEKIKTTPLFVCGSPFFIALMKKTLMDLGSPKKNIYYEELGF
jgi:predicted ferric reductase